MDKEKVYTNPEEEIWEEEIYLTEDDDPKRFEIDGLGKADWAFRKVKEERQEIERLEKYAKEQIEKINEWLHKETLGPKQSINYMEFLLGEYYKKLREENPKAKLTTQNGKFTSRKLQPKWHFEEEKMIEYLKENDPDKILEVTKITFNKTDVKKNFTIMEVEGELKAIDENGQALDGIISLEPQSDSYSIKTDL